MKGESVDCETKQPWIGLGGGALLSQHRIGGDNFNLDE
jgi:hypothetical protein